MGALGRIIGIAALLLALRIEAGAEATREKSTKIIGMPKVQSHLRALVRVAKPGVVEAEHLGRFPRNTLIIGGAGSGKTLLLRQLKEQKGFETQTLEGSKVAEVKDVEEAWQTAVSSERRVVLAIDNVDKMPEAAQARLATLMEGIDSRRPEHVFVVATASSEADVKGPLKTGRFERKLTIPALTRPERHELLTLLTKNTPLAGDVDLQHVAAKTAGRSGRSLRNIVRVARQFAFEDADPEDVEAFERLAPGDKVPADLAKRVRVKRDHFERSIEEHPAGALDGLKVITPSVTMDDVGGLEDQKRWLNRFIIQPGLHPERYTKVKRQMRGVTFYGPPGTGKSLLAEAVAHEMGAQLIHLDPTSVYEKWLGESGRNLERILEGAIASAEPGSRIVLFMDEAEGLGRSRGTATDGASGEEGRVMSQLLQTISGSNKKFKNVTLIMATNRPDVLDAALKRSGRSDGMLKIPGPNAVSRQLILRARLKHTPLAKDVNLGVIAQRAKRFSGADLDKLASMAELIADEHGAAEVRMRDFEEALKEPGVESTLGKDAEVEPD